jgi:hypothetical protein
MATRRYKLSPGNKYELMVEEVGLATVSNVVELTVDLATTTMNNVNGGTRQIQKEEVLEVLTKFKDHILAGKWPPA